MAEEQPIVETAAAPPTENGSGENGGAAKKQFKREELVPIEELFDLSKPIPKVGHVLFCYVLRRIRYVQYKRVQASKPYQTMNE